MMRRLLIFIVAACIAYACASSKKAVDISIGSWGYTIEEVPDVGNLKGTFVLAKEGDNYTGSLNGGQGSTTLDNITIVDKVLNCSFYYEGYLVKMTGNFEGDGFTGKCSAEGYDFPMTAVRQQ